MLEFWTQYGFPAVIAVAFLAYVIPKVVEYLDKKSRHYEELIDEQSKKCQEKVSQMIQDHRTEMTEIASQYEARLEVKDARINQVVDSTYKAIHEMTVALEKNTRTMADVNERIRPVEEVLPKVITLTSKIDDLFNATKNQQQA